MNKCVTAIVFAGVAVSANAHDFSLAISATTTHIYTGSPFSKYLELNVYGDASVGTHMLGGSFSLTSTGFGGPISSMAWRRADWSMLGADGGYAGNGNYNQVAFGQLFIPGMPPFDIPGPGSELGGLIGTFEIEFFNPSVGFIDFQLIAGNPFSLEVVDADTGKSYDDIGNDLELGSFRLVVIPSPSPLALLGVAGIAAARKRTRS